MPHDDEDVLDLGPRAVIGRAVEVLMSRDCVSRDDAFELLVARSSDSRRLIRDVAADVIRTGGG